MTIRTKLCVVCGQSADIEVDETSYYKWRRGALIQDAFPNLSPDDRELLISGTHPACWKVLFGDLTSRFSVKLG